MGNLARIIPIHKAASTGHKTFHSLLLFYFPPLWIHLAKSQSGIGMRIALKKLIPKLNGSLGNSLWGFS